MGEVPGNTAPPKTAKIVMGALVLLAIAAAVVGGAIYFLQTSGIQASVIWTGAVGIGTWLVRSIQERRDEYRRLLADTKRQQYEGFLLFVNKVAGAEKKKREAAIDLDEMRIWSLRLGLVGSDDV